MSKHSELVKCPNCLCDHCHPARVRIGQGRTTAVVTNERCEVVSHGIPTHRRGSEVRIAFVCEEGHEFEIVYQFHKGQTILEIDEYCDPLESRIARGLWRD